MRTVTLEPTTWSYSGFCESANQCLAAPGFRPCYKLPVPKEYTNSASGSLAGQGFSMKNEASVTEYQEIRQTMGLQVSLIQQPHEGISVAW